MQEMDAPPKKIRWWVPELGPEEKKFMDKALDTSFPNEGELTTQFETQVAGMLGCKHAIAVTSGTAAIFLALKACGVKQGDEVVVPDISFIATANAAEMCGAKPVMVDVDPESMCISPEAFERSITKKTKAVVPVHVSGRAADLDGVGEVAVKHGIRVVEDAAEAFMSKHNGRYLGTLGEIGCLSFSPHKIITTGQGGMLLTNDDNLLIRIKELKDHGRRVRGTGGDDLHDVIGYNFKFTDLQAAVGLGQLTYVKKRMERMLQRHRIYGENLQGIKGLRLFDFDVQNGEMPLWTDAIIEKRDELDKYLTASSIGCRRYWFPLHRQKPYALPDDKFPNSTSMSPKALWLSSAYTLSDSDVNTVCERIKAFLK